MRNQSSKSPLSTPSFKLESMFKWIEIVYAFFSFKKKKKNFLVDEYEDIW